jgi:membrane-bound ClpP family serine protease
MGSGGRERDGGCSVHADRRATPMPGRGPIGMSAIAAILVIAGATLMVAEAHVPTHGVLSTGAAAALTGAVVLALSDAGAPAGAVVAAGVVVARRPRARLAAAGEVARRAPAGRAQRAEGARRTRGARALGTGADRSRTA